MIPVILAVFLWAVASGAAAAKITLVGDARMGVITDAATAKPLLISRAKFSFILTGTTDSGLTFGTSIGSPENDRASRVSAGALYISGGFGRLAVGDVDGAATAAIGHVAGVGLISASDQNEVSYIANAGGGFRPAIFGNTARPSALYRYRAGDLQLFASVTQPGGTGPDAYSLAASYSADGYLFAIGVERENTATALVHQIIVGARGVWGPVSAKVIYGKISTSLDGFDATQWAMSATYTAQTFAVTTYYTDDSDIGRARSNAIAYGIGASYPLGDGATLVGGYYRNQTFDQTGFEFGVTLSF